MSRRQLLTAGAAMGAGGLLTGCVSSGRSGSGPSTQAVTSNTPAPGSPEAVLALDAQTRGTLDSVFDQHLKASGIAGMAAAVWSGNREWRRSGGFADLQKQRPYDEGDFVRIGGVTRSYTATAVLQLVDAGSLQLDDPVERFVPGIPNGKTITVRHLLALTSGLFDYTADSKFRSRYEANPTMGWSFANTLSIVKAHPPPYAPGAQFAYGDTSYAILGEVLAKVAGKPAGAVITDSILKRMGLQGTGYPSRNTIADPHPTGYVPAGVTPETANNTFDNAGRPPRVVNDINPAVSGPAGAMISTLDDLRTWGREVAVGSLLKRETQTVRLTARRVPGSTVNLGYGLGCEVLNDFVGHTGATFGFSSVVFHNAQNNVTIVAVGNESNTYTTPTAAWAYLVVKSLFPDQWK